MKKNLVFLLAFVLATVISPRQTDAQSVAINADSSLADPSAILDLKTTIKGFLAPRMTQAQRNAIAVPAVGLLIYQTDNTPGFYCYDGAAWGAVKGSGGTISGGPDTLWSASGNNISSTNTGDVHIGTNLGIGGAPASLNNKLQIGDVGTAGYNGNDFAIGNNNQAFGLGVQFDKTVLTATGAMIFLPRTGTIGINTTSPHNKLQIGDVTGLYNNDLAIGEGDQSFTVNVQPGKTTLGTSGNMILAAGGYVGINTTTPTNKLQIGTLTTSSFVAGHDLLIANNTVWASFDQLADRLEINSPKDIFLQPGSDTGNVGIDIVAGKALNKLQIGNVGSTGFVGNDFAIGASNLPSNYATAFNQYATAFQVASTTDIGFLPQTGSGKVGINTSTPRATLDVVGSYKITGGGYTYMNFDGDLNGLGEGGYPGAYIDDVSIWASNRVYASEFDAYSDVRIKNLIGTSDAKKDFDAINKIAIRNYTMKDKLKYGNHHFKKVIAQELEKIDPDLVSKHTDFIPNVYQVTDLVTKTLTGYKLHFANPHHLGDTAKKLQALTTNSGSLQSFNIVSIPSPTEVIIDAKEIKTDTVFVYGEQVPNFRTVDYEGLTTLNISATQELSRQVKELQKALATANKNIRTLAKMLQQKASITNHLTSTQIKKL